MEKKKEENKSLSLDVGFMAAPSQIAIRAKSLKRVALQREPGDSGPLLARGHGLYSTLPDTGGFPPLKSLGPFETYCRRRTGRWSFPGVPQAEKGGVGLRWKQGSLDRNQKNEV